MRTRPMPQRGLRGRCLLSFSAAIFAAALAQPSRAGEQDGRLDIYFIDVEGGAATLIVTPAGESILIDSGYPGLDDRDAQRILYVVRDVAGLERIDHSIVTHWHADHYGSIPAVSRALPVVNWWDRGVPDSLQEDPNFPTLVGRYLAACRGENGTLHAGDTLPLAVSEGGTPLELLVVAGNRQFIEREGPPNPFAALHEPQPEDTTDNANSLGVLLTFGEFQYLCLGDLTWNMEYELATPSNPLGEVDLFQVTHHGLAISNNPVLVRAVNPVVAVCCNGPHKGAHPSVIATLRECSNLQAIYQLHLNLDSLPEENTAPEFIANREDPCQAVYVHASIAPDGSQYTLRIGDGEPRDYRTQ